MRKQILGYAAAAALALPVGGTAVASTSGAGTGEAYSLGRCIVKADRSAAVRLMNQLPLAGDSTNLDASQLGKASRCLGASASGVSAMALRGGIAQELFLKDFEEFGVRPQREVADFADYDLPVEEEAGNVPADTHALFRLGECAVRNDTVNAVKLLRAPVGSQQEMNIINSMRPMLGACQPAGSNVAIGRGELRSVMAQAAYHVSARYWRGDLKTPPKGW